jgi:transposase
VWERLHALLLAELHADGRIDWSRGRRQLPRPGQKGDDQVGPSPVDRGRPGSKHHLLTDATGIPLAVRLTAANRNDITQLLPLLQQVPPVRGRRGRPRRRPKQLVADRGYDSATHRQALRALGIRPVIAKRGVEHGSGLGRWRWVIERVRHEAP